MMLIKSFFRRIIKDFRHKELLPLKMIFFVQASTLYVLYPYLTIHMRELGINVEETAIMSAITPVIAMVMPPLAGMLADRVGNFKILLSLFSLFGGIAAPLLLLVPLGRITVELPDRVVMDLSCAENNNGLLYTMSQNHPCETSLQPKIFTRIESCGYMCHLDTYNDTEVQSILSSRMYSINRHDTETGANSLFKFSIPQEDMPQEKEQDLREHRKLKNNENFKTSIRQFSKNEYFFPSNQLYEFSCTPSGFVEDFYSSTLDTTMSKKMYENRTLCAFKPIVTHKDNVSQAINYHSYKSKLKSLEITDEDREMNRQRYLAEEMAWTEMEFQKITCGNSSLETDRIVLTLPLFNYSISSEPYEILNTEDCSKRCIVTAPRQEMCSNTDTVIEYNIRLTFWLYFAVRVFISVIGGTTFAMFEGAVIAILREQKADYGLQRIYGSIGGIISSPLSGLLIDYASYGKGYTDFRPAFYLYAGLKLVSGLLMLAINLEFKSPSTNVVHDVSTVLRNVEAAALFIACFILGTAWGYIESFLFWLIQDLGGSRSLMGITITVGGIAGIPLLVLSGPIISKIGHANVLFIGFVFYAIRLCGYSLIYNPWHTLIFEALESVTLSLSFTAAVTYAAKLSTTTTDSSIQGLLGGVYYGVGKGSGSLIGGYLMKAYGTRPTYRIFAVVTLITGIMYYIFNVAYLKKRPQVEGNDIVKKKPKHVENQNGLDIGLEEIGVDNQAFTKEGNTEQTRNRRKEIEEKQKEQHSGH
ncbi:Major facilitator superfamily domain-containing protein 6-A [Habropoda laboriosa]|uniref:Major facilitator superfamily domain-containing protein 6-A n=1 Tax=Habropoda laboriosa TaxID=597456 RepID=A0A0L7R427_9HYME|nr:Major facilitator superfamily domain-containing protein 6-A [Habropoda laboriosa]